MTSNACAHSTSYKRQWSAHPGRSIDAYWGGNTLYFDLSSVGEDDTTLITIVALTVGAVAAVAVAIVYFRKKVRT
jgi:hypothetical protein